MGENIYCTKKPGDHGWEDVEIVFSEEVDFVFGCLCNFPYAYDKGLDIDTVRSLALLGAAVALIRNSDEIDTKDMVILPDAVPEWIRKEIIRFVK